MESKGSLLEDFINGEIENYQEPERRGVPKGEKIGFTKSKHAACLLTGLLNTPAKPLAEKYGKDSFSYGLLRKWRSEPEFKAEAKNFASKLASHLVSYISDEVFKNYEEFQKYLDGKANDIYEININPIKPNARLLSNEVVNYLKAHVNYYVDNLEKEPSLTAKIIHFKIIKEIAEFVSYIENKPIPVKVGKFELIAIRCIIDEVFEIIYRSNLPEKDLIHAGKLLDIIRDYIVDVTNVMED